MYPPHIIAVAAIMMASSTMEDNRITRAVEDWVTSLVDVPMKEASTPLLSCSENTHPMDSPFLSAAQHY